MNVTIKRCTADGEPYLSSVKDFLGSASAQTDVDSVLTLAQATSDHLMEVVSEISRKGQDGLSVLLGDKAGMAVVSLALADLAARIADSAVIGPATGYLSSKRIPVKPTGMKKRGRKPNKVARTIADDLAAMGVAIDNNNNTDKEGTK